jgi:peptidyl-tRNA hydrolase, PTH1 family
MILIIGLGNPGTEYALTRHNIGFLILDRIIEDLERKKEYLKFRSAMTESEVSGKKVLLQRPLTYMNDSGISVNLLLKKTEVDFEKKIIIHDDIDIEFGKIKFKKDGGTAGHRGLESIKNITGSFEFDRLRFGVGRPAGTKTAANYVLKKFLKRELEEIPVLVELCAQAILDYIEKDVAFCMNKYN